MLDRAGNKAMLGGTDICLDICLTQPDIWWLSQPDKCMAQLDVEYMGLDLYIGDNF